MFKKKLINVPNSRVSGRKLLKICDRALDTNTKVVAATITGGDFICLHWEKATKILD